MSLLERCEAFVADVARVEPGVLSGQDCARLAEALARVEKACGAARARLAARAAGCGAHRRAGYADAAAWLARTTGSSLGTARAELRSVEELQGCVHTERALRRGELSLAQAGEIARTEAACPGAEAELLGEARRSGLSGLKDRARQLRLAALDVDELAARQHRARHLRCWTDAEGMVRLSGALEPRVGLRLVSRLEAEAQRRRRRARRSGCAEAFEAHAADALAALVQGEAKLRRGRAEVVFVCDLRAYRRGRAEPGEPCHILGGGPVPVPVVDDELGDAFVKAVTHDGVRIDTVAHYGRTIPAHLRTALDLGHPPRFEGARCVDCGRSFGLQIDHVDPVANGGATSAANLRHRCVPCHGAKTERDRAAGLLGAALRRAIGLEEGGHDPP